MLQTRKMNWRIKHLELTLIPLPRIDQHQLTIGKILHIAGRQGHPPASGDGRYLGVEVSDRAAGSLAPGSNLPVNPRLRLPE